MTRNHPLARVAGAYLAVSIAGAGFFLIAALVAWVTSQDGSYLTRSATVAQGWIYVGTAAAVALQGFAVDALAAWMLDLLRVAESTRDALMRLDARRDEGEA